MDNKKDTPELNVKMPPPVVPKKEGDSNGAKKKLFIIIPIIAVLVIGAVVTAVLLKNNKDKLPPVVVTDYNGEVVTDESGVPVTVVPETEIFKYTNVAGEKLTSIIYKEETVYVPKTDIYGEKVTEKYPEFEHNLIEIDASEWGADKAYHSKDGYDQWEKLYVLCYPNVIAKVTFPQERVIERHRQAVGKILAQAEYVPWEK